MSAPSIAVFAGGTSSEREVSLGSGAASASALARSFPTRLMVVNAEALPAGFNPAEEVVFSALHGTFGEDGGMQRLLDAAGAQYAGCDTDSSALTMDKTRTKETVAARGVRVAPGIVFSGSGKPSPSEVAARLGTRVVLKPNDQGSSVGLAIVDGPSALEAALGKISTGSWLAEKWIEGREFSVGILNGRAMGVVEIRPKAGVYDFASKYTKGMTEYLAPAPLDPGVTAAIQAAAETAFAACGCRDYGRVDFMLQPGGDPFLLEINTLPGMKETSLLPMSARCAGLDFIGLVREMVAPALQRYRASVPAFQT